jgi:hypothetical protein
MQGSGLEWIPVDAGAMDINRPGLFSHSVDQVDDEVDFTIYGVTIVPCDSTFAFANVGFKYPSRMSIVELSGVA